MLPPQNSKDIGYSQADLKARAERRDTRAVVTHEGIYEG